VLQKSPFFFRITQKGELQNKLFRFIRVRENLANLYSEIGFDRNFIKTTKEEKIGNAESTPSLSLPNGREKPTTKSLKEP